MEMYHFYLQITFNFLHVKICRTVNGLDRFTEEMFVIQRRYILVYFIMQLCQDYGLAQQRAKDVKTKMQNWPTWGQKFAKYLNPQRISKPF